MAACRCCGQATNGAYWCRKCAGHLGPAVVAGAVVRLDERRYEAQTGVPCPHETVVALRKR